MKKRIPTAEERKENLIKSACGCNSLRRSLAFALARAFACVSAKRGLFQHQLCLRVCQLCDSKTLPELSRPSKPSFLLVINVLPFFPNTLSFFLWHGQTLLTQFSLSYCKMAH